MTFNDKISDSNSHFRRHNKCSLAALYPHPQASRASPVASQAIMTPPNAPSSSSAATTSCPPAENALNQQHQHQPPAQSQISSRTARLQSAHTGSGPTPANYLSFTSSAAFQQVKQTQASLARLSRVHQLQQQQNQNQAGQNNQSSQTSVAPSGHHNVGPTTSTTGNNRSTTFVDCLIRRFKDCFSEDFCTVPMFVVGNLSPGSDGEFFSICTTHISPSFSSFHLTRRRLFDAERPNETDSLNECKRD